MISTILHSLFLVQFAIGAGMQTEEAEVMTANAIGAIYLSVPTRAGTLILPPAEYKIYCEHTDSGHQIVFVRLQETNPFLRWPYSGSDSDIVKIPCTMQKTSFEVQGTEVHLLTDATGQRYIHHVRIKGESVMHVFQQ